MKEKWHPVPGFEGHYEVSNLGGVRTVKRIKPRANNRGYLSVTLCTPEKTESLLVHRLVAQAFLGEMQPGMVVNHKDFDPRNNQAANLEICSQKENARHSIERIRAGVARGEAHCNASLTVDQVREIRRRFQTGESQTGIAASMGLHKMTVHSIVRGKTWRSVV